MKKNEIEMLVGRFTLTIMASIILAIIVLGVVYLVGTFVNWVEGNTIRYIIFIITMLIIIVKIALKEMEE